MLVHNDPLLYIFFGDARTSFTREILMKDDTEAVLWEHPHIARLKKMVGLESLILLTQTHSSAGEAVTPENVCDLLEHKREGDFLVTQVEHAGLVVYTADCLPIIFYDTYNRAIGICHAGWRGSLEEVAIKTLQALQRTYGTDLDHVRIFFGPSARACCYEVSEDFTHQFRHLEYADDIFVSHGNRLFFDLPLFNKLQLEAYGVKREAFHCRYNLCTICDEAFCSSRRDKESNQRQITVAMLK